MFEIAFIVLLTAHLLGDYYFQTEKLARQKERSIKKVCIHGVIYGAACFAVIAPIMDKWFLIAASIAALTHFLIDTGKWKYLSSSKAGRASSVYIVNQSAHIICLFVAALVVAGHKEMLLIQPAVETLLQLLNIDFVQLLSWLLVLLFLWKPANVAVKKILAAYKPAKENDPGGKAEKRAGAFIGSLERLIMLMFLAIGQYAAIGLVLTAKSIARYDKISKDQEFAEYYLLGTLLSTAMAMICYFAFLHD